MRIGHRLDPYPRLPLVLERLDFVAIRRCAGHALVAATGLPISAPRLASASVLAR